MGDFYDTVRDFARRLRGNNEEGRTISGGDIPDLFAGNGEIINCYPGTPTDICHTVAFAVSLTARSITDHKRNHLWFEGALNCAYEHLFNSKNPCAQKTKAIVIVTDNWDARIWESWADKISIIKSVAHLEIYLLVDFEPYEIKA